MVNENGIKDIHVDKSHNLTKQVNLRFEGGNTLLMGKIYTHVKNE